MKYLSLFILFFASLSGCKKSNDHEEVLPPITQTGANTFGCLINGKIYIPKGFEQNHPNFDVIVDSTNGGNLDIRTFRKENGIMQALSFSCFGISSSGIYQTQIYPTYAKDINSSICYFVNSGSNYKQGFIQITRYDINNRIFSGTFEMKMYDSTISCDTILITQGRFDKKLN